MAGLDLPFFGSLVLGAVLVVAAYTFALGIIAGRGRPELNPAVRLGVYATWAMVAVAVLTLAYAFQAHDFRVRYVLRYSDRSMPWYYLCASLWGGQDGSLLWWSFLLVTYSAVCARSLKNRLPELAPYILSTLMSILMFFCVLMLFAANPFSIVAAGAAPDGEGLNPLLQNYWMMIHPPMLYTGLVGWSVPFGFVVAALVTGRLTNEWITASRRFTLFAFIALAVGNILGMIWSYEELGWGGYWAWDPVENAAFMPLLAGTPFLHSVMLQERRGMFKVWNVFLLCLTFFMTILGTFLTRSGMIASVHSFARSSIGIYFVWYMAFIVLVCGALIIWRLPLLRSQARIDSLLSRDFVFLLNNWILMGMLFFVLIATTFPLISDALRGEEVTVGPGYYNKWMVPLGLVLLSLTGIGPLLAWRKSTRAHLWRVMLVPSLAALVMVTLHALVGPRYGYPAYVKSDDIYDTLTGRVLAVVYGCAPVLSTSVCSFLLAGHLQEFWRGTRLRMRNAGESFLVALFELVSRAKRRYGGYLVHLGLVAMYFGFTGSSYDVDKEAALRPGQSLEVRGFKIRYDGSRMEVDPAGNRRMVFSDMTVLRDGKRIADISPAKFVYSKPPDTATTEVAIRSTLTEDIYAIMNSVNPETKLGTFRVIVRPFVSWIWLGGLFLIFGTSVCMAPSVREVLGEVSARSPQRTMPALATSILLLLTLGGVAFAVWQTAHAQAAAQSISISRWTPDNSNPISINDRYLDAFDGTRIAYRVEGSGPALVLTNGLTTTTNFWKYLRPVWLQRHTIVTWDLPGHGNSSPARSAASTDLYAQPRIIAEVMRVAGVARAVQIGWSTGSQVVLEMYRQFPELCESLVLLLGGSGHALDHTRLPLGGSAIDRLARTLSPRAFTRLHRVLSAGFQQPRAFGVGRWLGLIGPRVTREDMQQFTAHIASVDPQSLLLMLRSCQAHDASSVLASMRVPLLIVAGDNDPFAPTDRVGLVMQRAAARCEFLRLHDGTHTALLEQPELIADTVERFIAKAGTRAAAD